MARKTGLAKALARRGVENLVTVAGWESRGSATFAPFGTLDHWTAGPRTGNNPSLNICVFGRDGLPGPLCHVLLGRTSTFLIAAGRANHAGAGYYLGADGNTDLFGLEIEWSGARGELNDYQLRQVPRINAAFRDLGSRFEAGHDEYALPRGRKVDVGPMIHQFRAATAKVLAGTTSQPTQITVPTQEDTLSKAEVEEIKQYMHALLIGGYTTDGQRLPGMSKVDIETQRALKAEKGGTRFIQKEGSGAVFITDGLLKQGIPNPTAWAEFKRIWGDSPLVREVRADVWELIPDVNDLAGASAAHVKEAVRAVLAEIPLQAGVDTEEIADKVADRFVNGIEITGTITTAKEN